MAMPGELPDDLTIRRIRADEAAVLREVRLRMLLVDPASFSATHASEAAEADEHWAERARRLAAGDDAAQLLALDRSGPVGAVVVVRDDEDRALFHLHAMWVAPERRGLGLGAHLLAAAEAWIAAAGGREAELSVTSAAPVAARLYARSGYVPDGREAPSPHTPGLIERSLRKRL
jgi:GNAT superfamily N-acetyltransferase